MIVHDVSTTLERTDSPLARREKRAWNRTTRASLLLTLTSLAVFGWGWMPTKDAPLSSPKTIEQSGTTIADEPFGLEGFAAAAWRVPAPPPAPERVEPITPSLDLIAITLDAAAHPRATLYDRSTGGLEVLSPGQTTGSGWEVITIDVAAVTLRSPDRRHTVRLAIERTADPAQGAGHVAGGPPQ